MKRKIGILFFLLGLYLVLFSSWRFLSNSYIDRDWIVECKKKEFLSKNPGVPFDIRPCLLEYENKLLESRDNNTVKLIIGSIFLIVGLGFLYKLIKDNLMNKLNQKTFLIDFFELFTNISYWLLIGLLYFSMQLIAKSKVTNCMIDSMFIFYIAGFVGFYSSYFFLTNRYFSNKRFLSWFIGIIITMIIGSFLAYFVPFYLKDISRIKLNTFLNVAFLQGFVLMSFFIFANVITGMILKGFFNWIRIILKNK